MTAHRALLGAAALALAGCGDADPPTTGSRVATSESAAATLPSATSSVAPTEPADDDAQSDGTLLPPGSIDEIFVESGDTGGAIVTGEAPRQIVDDLIERISKELGIDPGDVTVVTSFAKTWTDGALGCAEPGIVYTQREQAGYQVELEAADESWDFRVRESGDVILCADGLVQPRPP